MVSEQHDIQKIIETKQSSKKVGTFINFNFIRPRNHVVAPTNLCKRENVII